MAKTNETDQLAIETKQAADTAATGSFITGAFKGMAAIASLFTGGATTIGLDGLGAIR